jgi:glycosyltransferase involved in cell wall biosynthesis
MTRVVLLTTNLARGGAEVQVAQLASSLHRRNWNVSVVSLLRPMALERELRAAGVPVWSLDAKTSPLALGRLVSILNRLQPHIVHAHMFHANLAARAIRLVCPIPALISTIHSVAESSRRSAGIRGRDWLYRVSDWLSDQTVCVSAAAAERHVAARAVSLARLRIIPNGVDTVRFRPDGVRRVQTRTRLGLGEEFAWLAAGRLMWKKNYSLMLQAMAEQRSGKLLIAGEGPEEPELRALAGKLGVHARFLGSREDIADLMNACDGFVLSSVVEGLPMVLLEAASSGLPQVATLVGGVDEAVVRGKTGYLVPPGDASALAAAMARLMELSLEARLGMAQAAREHALARFDLRAVTESWEQLYAEVLESGRVSGREP